MCKPWPAPGSAQARAGVLVLAQVLTSWVAGCGIYPEASQADDPINIQTTALVWLIEQDPEPERVTCLQVAVTELCSWQGAQAIDTTETALMSRLQDLGYPVARASECGEGAGVLPAGVVHWSSGRPAIFRYVSWPAKATADETFGTMLGTGPRDALVCAGESAGDDTCRDWAAMVRQNPVGWDVEQSWLVGDC